MSLAAAWTPQAGGQDAQQIAISQSLDDDSPDPGFSISQMGPVILLPDHTGPTSRPDWIQFDRDQCGVLKGIEDRQSIFSRSAYGDGGFAEDDEDSPGRAGEQMFDQWLSAHSVIAVNGAIDRWCDEGDDDGFGDIETSDIA